MKDTSKIFINSLIAGALVTMGACVNSLTQYGFKDLDSLILGSLLGVGTGAIVFLTKLQAYYDIPVVVTKVLQHVEPKTTVKLFDFI